MLGLIRNGMVFLALFYGVIFCGDSTSQSSPAVQEKNEFKVVNAKKFVFSYKVDGDNLIARISYPTAGWVGVGFNPVKMMQGANFIIGSVAGDKTVISDEFGATKYSHAPDTAHGGKYDIVNSSVVSEKGMMTMSFTIPLRSGDDKDVVLEKGKPIKVIFAAGKKPDLGKKHSFLAGATITL